MNNKTQSYGDFGQAISSGIMNKVTIIGKRIANNRVLVHVLAWTAFVVTWIVYAALWGNPIYELVVNKLCYLGPQMLATYYLLYYQLPKLVYKKRYGQFLLSLLFTAYFTSALARLIKIYVYEPAMGATLPKDSLYDIFTQLFPLAGQYLLWVYIPPIMAVTLKLLKDHFIEKQQFEQLRQEKTIAELNFLQAQLHPHFLFNTLNNLYTLTIHKSEKAPALILQLSEIVDYMFEECKEDQVSVVKEVQLLQNYIDLELLRYGDRLSLDFTHQIDDPSATIAPLILLSIVENAFKHGASGDMGQPKIKIDLSVQKGVLHFRVFNTKVAIAQSDLTDFKKGIGVNNIKRQLALGYPGVHHLITNVKPTSYELILDIQLQTNTSQKRA